MALTPETEAEILRRHHADHWPVGTIATQLNLHRDSVARVLSQAGLPLAGWIANDIQPPARRHPEYLATLKRVLPAPFLGEIPWLAEAAQREDLGQYLDLSALDRASSTSPAAEYPAG